jgi:hypothetical protein
MPSFSIFLNAQPSSCANPPRMQSGSYASRVQSSAADPADGQTPGLTQDRLCPQEVEVSVSNHAGYAKP